MPYPQQRNFLLIQYNYFMTDKRTESARKNHFQTKRQEFKPNYIPPNTSTVNAYFPFSAQTHSFHYNYAFPYSYSYPYAYIPNPYCHPYSEAPHQGSNMRMMPSLQNMGHRHMDGDIIELSTPGEVKVEAQEHFQSQEQEGEIVNLPSKNYPSTAQRTSERKNYKRKQNMTNSQIRMIFSGLIRTLVSQEGSLIKKKLQVKKCLIQASQTQVSDNFYDSLFQTLKKKFAQFKKTKEEMIKYIIRRTYHNYKLNKSTENRPEFQRLQLFHSKNLSLYKSMNSEFLRKQFSNKLFLQIYKDFLDRMDEQFDKENQEKIDRLSFILSYGWLDKNLKLLSHQKKLPWNMTSKRRVKQIAYDLLKQFQPQSSNGKQDLEIK